MYFCADFYQTFLGFVVELSERGREGKREGKGRGKRGKITRERYYGREAVE